MKKKRITRSKREDLLERLREIAKRLFGYPDWHAEAEDFRKETER